MSKYKVTIKYDKPQRMFIVRCNDGKHQAEIAISEYSGILQLSGRSIIILDNKTFNKAVVRPMIRDLIKLEADDASYSLTIESVYYRY